MLKATLLATALLAAPALAQDLPRSAVVAQEYFSRECVDAKERFGVYAPTEDRIHDLTQQGTQEYASFTDASIRPYCRQETLSVFHCHPTNDPVSLFPGTNKHGADFALAAHLEYLCTAEAVEHGFTPPKLEHWLIHTGGVNNAGGTPTAVRYGLTTPLARIRELGVAQGEKASRLARMENITQLLSEQEDRDAELQSLYRTLADAYFAEVVAFVREQCPGVTTRAQWDECSAFTLERFIATRKDPPYFIEPFLPPPAPVVQAPVKAPTPFPSWATKITRENYERFIHQKRVLIVKCARDSIFHPSCDAAIDRAAQLRQYCYGLKVGIMDTDRFDVPNGLGFTDLESEKLYQHGFAMHSTELDLTPYKFGFAFCGVHMDARHNLVFTEDPDVETTERPNATIIP